MVAFVARVKAFALELWADGERRREVSTDLCRVLDPKRYAAGLPDRIRSSLRSPQRRLLYSAWSDVEGSAVVEAAVLTPLLIILFLGVFEFAWCFYNQHVAEIGVRDAARYLSRGPYLSSAAFISEGTDPCSDTNKTAAKNLAVTGTVDGSGSARIQGWTTADVTVTCTSFDNTGLTYDGPSFFYRVTVSTSFADPALGYFALLGLGVPTLSASHMERAFGSG